MCKTEFAIGFFAQEKYVVYSEPHPDIAAEIERVPEVALLYGPFTYSKAFVDDYVDRWKELQTKYQPDMPWVDDFPIYTRDGNRVRDGKMRPEIKYFDDQVRAMITDLMNNGARRGQAVYCNNKGGNSNWPDGVSCREKDNLKLKVSGPKWQVERMSAMGDWLWINGAAIYGTRYWKVNAQDNEQLAFTTKGQSLFAIKLAQPSRPFTIEATQGWKASQVKSVGLLGSDAPVAWAMTAQGLLITPPSDLGSSMFAWSFEIVTDQVQHPTNER